ncbi:hypothetical protein B0H13DRAFT_1935527 [Mycena leptocephala]|nr:hypothetical protein B0H13DRAFT_1935527 [Mycena leptocephala]
MALTVALLAGRFWVMNGHQWPLNLSYKTAAEPLTTLVSSHATPHPSHCQASGSRPYSYHYPESRPSAQAYTHPHGQKFCHCRLPAPVPSIDQPLRKSTRAGTTKRSAPVDYSTAVLSADLPPLPKRMRTEAPEIDADTMKKCEKDFDREIRTAISKAKENMVVMAAFDFDRAAANKKQLKASIPSHVWMDDTPRMAVSNDGVPLVIHLPQAMKEASTV